MNRVYTVEGFIYSREGLSVCVGCVSGMRRPSSTPREGHSDASDKRVKGIRREKTMLCVIGFTPCNAGKGHPWVMQRIRLYVRAMPL